MNQSDLEHKSWTLPSSSPACSYIVPNDNSQTILNLEVIIAHHHNEIKMKVGLVHEQLRNDIFALNSQATATYDAVNKEANEEIQKLHYRIEEIVHNATVRQHEIYEDVCHKSLQVKNVANKRMQEITQNGDAMLQVLVGKLKEHQAEAHFPRGGVDAQLDDIEISKYTSRNDLPLGSAVGGGCSFGNFNRRSSSAGSFESIPSAGLCSSSSSGSSSDYFYDPSANDESTWHKKLSSQYPMTQQWGYEAMKQVNVDSWQAISSPDAESQQLLEWPVSCEFMNCSKRPSCNYPGERFGRYCGAHKLSGMINVMYKRCEATGCTKMPGFNFADHTERRFCAAHKLEGMVNIQGRGVGGVHRISYNDNDTDDPAVINSPQNESQSNSKRRKVIISSSGSGDTTETSDTPEELEVKDNKVVRGKGGRCEAEGCKKHPSFNTKGLIGGRFCSAHKLFDMVDVISKRCEMCSKQAAFNFKGQSRGRFCSGHKVSGMINVKDKLCEMIGCSKYPTANFEGHSGRRFCTTHKLEGMVNFTNKRCEAVGCVKHPKFNFVGYAGRRFCSAHKLDGMISIS